MLRGNDACVRWSIARICPRGIDGCPGEGFQNRIDKGSTYLYQLPGSQKPSKGALGTPWHWTVDLYKSYRASLLCHPNGSKTWSRKIIKGCGLSHPTWALYQHTIGTQPLICWNQSINCSFISILRASCQHSGMKNDTLHMKPCGTGSRTINNHDIYNWYPRHFTQNTKTKKINTHMNNSQHQLQ